MKWIVGNAIETRPNVDDAQGHGPAAGQGRPAMIDRENKRGTRSVSFDPARGSGALHSKSDFSP